MKYNILSYDEKLIIEDKHTEKPFSGIYNDFKEEGIYKCKKCNSLLYKSTDKFDSKCGWPSFDDEITNAVKKVVDIDGMRTEIVCNTCLAHLGHIFKGEYLTSKNTRHCVNSLSLSFQSSQIKEETLSFAYFAGGCFWGVEYYFKKSKGVNSVVSGYMGGHITNPTYSLICSGNSGHLEAVKIEFDENEISFKSLAKLFFEIHDFTQINGQGPDIGSQYLSAIFYTNEEQKNSTLELISNLKAKNYKVATSLYEFETFYEAEDEHQNYYEKHNQVPYCHKYNKIF